VQYGLELIAVVTHFASNFSVKLDFWFRSTGAKSGGYSIGESKHQHVTVRGGRKIARKVGCGAVVAYSNILDGDYPHSRDFGEVTASWATTSNASEYGIRFLRIAANDIRVIRHKFAISIIQTLQLLQHSLALIAQLDGHFSEDCSSTHSILVTDYVSVTVAQRLFVRKEDRRAGRLKLQRSIAQPFEAFNLKYNLSSSTGTEIVYLWFVPVRVSK
jgi:hypothetical protein